MDAAVFILFLAGPFENWAVNDVLVVLLFHFGGICLGNGLDVGLTAV